MFYRNIIASEPAGKSGGRRDSRIECAPPLDGSFSLPKEFYTSGVPSNCICPDMPVDPCRPEEQIAHNVTEIFQGRIVKPLCYSIENKEVGRMFSGSHSVLICFRLPRSKFIVDAEAWEKDSKS